MMRATCDLPLAVDPDAPYGQNMSMHGGQLPETKPDGQAYEVIKPDAQWRERLTPDEYHVLRQAGTERPYVGEYTDTKTRGTYSCRACSAELFTSDTKFDSHCGWPSFWSPLAGESVVEIEDFTMGMRRVEVRCASCGSHLGHVFSGEGYGTPTDQRYCINSISLKLQPIE
jgi:peptide-methionine (R)-S-oxide reductase